MDDFVVVTGAGKGIGKAASLLLAGHGYSIVSVSRTAQDLLSLRDEIEKKGVKNIPVACDVSRYDDFLAHCRESISPSVHIRALILNAGWGEWYPASQTPPEAWESMIGVNLSGAYHAFHAIYNHFSLTGNFQMIAVSSDSAYHPYASRAAYCSSKAALSMFAQCVREEIRESGHRVTELVPSRVDTWFRNKSPGARPDGLTPEDIAAIMLWILEIKPNIELRRIDLSSVNSTFGR